MRILKKIITVTLCAAAGLTAGCGSGQAPQPPRAIPEVAVVTLQPQKIMLSAELPGRTAPFRIAEIRPRVNGLILKRMFKEGSNVTAGQVLYRIDPAPLQAALDNAAANHTASRKAAARARAALEAGIADVARLEDALELARTNRGRFEASFADNLVSAMERDQAVTEAKVAASALRAGEAQVESGRQAVAMAEAAIGQAAAALKMARINLSYCRVTAPISGRIGKSAVTEGAVVTAYQPMALAVIQQLDPIYVDVPQSAAELLRLQKRGFGYNGSGQHKVKLTLDGGTDAPLEGTMQFSDVTVDPTTGSVILRVICPNPDGVLLPGMFVRALVDEGLNEQAILVPQQGVSRDRRGKPFALIVDDQSKVGMKMLGIDRAVGDKWLVSGGLAAGDRVIVAGLKMLRPGVSVKAVPFKKGETTMAAAVRPAGKSN